MYRPVGCIILFAGSSGNDDGHGARSGESYWDAPCSSAEDGVHGFGYGMTHVKSVNERRLRVGSRMNLVVAQVQSRERSLCNAETSRAFEMTCIEVS